MFYFDHRFSTPCSNVWDAFSYQMKYAVDSISLPLFFDILRYMFCSILPIDHKLLVIQGIKTELFKSFNFFHLLRRFHTKLSTNEGYQDFLLLAFVLYFFKFAWFITECAFNGLHYMSKYLINVISDKMTGKSFLKLLTWINSVSVTARNNFRILKSIASYGRCLKSAPIFVLWLGRHKNLALL